MRTEMQAQNTALRTEMQAGFSEIRTEMQATLSEICGYFVDPDKIKKRTRKTSTNNEAQVFNTADGAVNANTALPPQRPR